MRHGIWLIALAGAALVIPAWAEGPIPETRTMTAAFDLDAPVDDVWRAFTTKEGIESWMVPVAEVDLRTGGAIRTSYAKAEGIGGPSTITHNIVALEPERLLVAQTVPPENFPFKEALAGLTGVWLFEVVSPYRTRVTLSTHGWRDDETSRKAWGFFERANPTVYAELKKLFPPLESDGSTLQAIGKLRGDWTSTTKAQDGSAFEIRKSVQPGPGEKSWLLETSFVRGGRESLHKQVQVWLEPNGPVRFQALDEKGVRAHGVVHAEKDGTLVFDSEEPDGKSGKRRMRLRMKSASENEHSFAVQQRQPDGTFKDDFAVVYKRVQ